MKYIFAVSMVAAILTSCSPQDQSASQLAAAGETAFERGEYDKAIPLFTKAIDLDASNPSFFANRGNCYSYLNQFEKAFADFDKSIEVAIELMENSDDPRLAFLYYNRGYARERSRDPAKAVKDYDKALRVNPDYPDAHGNTAWILATSPDPRMRNGSKAVEYALIEAKQEEMQNASDLDTLAAAYAEVGNFDAAIETQKEAVSLAESEEERAEFSTRLALFQNGKPYREEADSTSQPAE